MMQHFAQNGFKKKPNPKMSQQMVAVFQQDDGDIGSHKVCSICKCSSDDPDPLNQAWTKTIFI